VRTQLSVGLATPRHRANGQVRSFGCVIEQAGRGFHCHRAYTRIAVTSGRRSGVAPSWSVTHPLRPLGTLAVRVFSGWCGRTSARKLSRLSESGLGGPCRGAIPLQPHRLHALWLERQWGRCYSKQLDGERTRATVRTYSMRQ
jgi:hypothetical protein